MEQNKPYEVRVVHGHDGYSLQVHRDEDGIVSGLRVLGSTAWGNPTNSPTCSWKLDKNDAKKLIDIMSAAFGLNNL